MDSLQRELARTPEVSGQIDLLYALADYYKEVDRRQATAYVDSALVLAGRLNDTACIAEAYYHYAEIEYDNGHKDQALDWADQALRAAVALKDSTLMAKIYLVSARIYENANQLQEALSAIETALTMADRIGADGLRGEAYHGFARVNYMLGDLDAAEAYLQRAITIFEPLDDIRKLASLYQGLSVVHEGAEAMPFIEKSYQYFEQAGDLEGMAFARSTIGTIYYEMDEFQQAESHFVSAIDLFEQIDLPVGIAYTELNLGTTLNELGRYSEAATHFERSLALAREHGYDDIKQLDFKGLAIGYALRADPGLIEAMLDSIQAIQDTLFSREKAGLLIEANKRFETQEKEAQIARQQLKIEKETRLRNGIIFGSVTLILGLAAIFQYVRSRQRLKRREAEMALRVKRAEAEKLRELDQLKSTFFANVSHEFRTPLSLILGPIQRAKEKLPEDQKLEAVESVPISGVQLQLLERNARRLQVLVEQLLDLSRLDSGKMRLHLRSGDIVAFLRSIVFSFESLAEYKHIRFYTEFPEAISSAYFDPDKLEKIVANILSNALKFTPPGGKVEVRVSGSSDQLQIAVSDTGPGIDVAEVDKIFDRFYQVEGRQEQGTGIGLALVRELVDLHKGEISVSSAPGRGTTFEIRLPVGRTSFRQEAVVEPDGDIELTEKEAGERFVGSAAGLPVAVEGPADDKHASIALIVEDNPDLRRYIAEILEADFQILNASDGAAGLQQAGQHLPDIIISDVMMPKMDGMELCRQLKADDKTSHIPIILLTARAGREHKIEGLEGGADDYLTKPFDHQELRLRVRNLIEQRDRLQEKFRTQLAVTPTQVKVSSVDERFLQQVKTEIEANMGDEQYSVEDLAQSVGFSRSQLHRKLKALCDRSPVEMIRDFRLTRARELLEQRAGNISEIAYQVGYSNLGYFSRSFKKQFGYSPSEVGTG